MKRLSFIIIALLFSYIAANAQNDIAVVRPDTTAFFYKIADAVTYAQSGDTIYLPGRSFVESITITKELHIIGTGHYIDSTQASGRTALYGTITFQNGSDNTSIEGLFINNDIVISNGHVSSNISIQRCSFYNLGFNYGEVTGLLISECIQRGTVINGNSNHKNVLIEKCIMNGELNRFENATLVTNCIFLKSTSGYGPIYLLKSSYIENCVFVSTGYFDNSCTGCTYTNNLMVSSSTIATSNAGYNNLQGVNVTTIFDTYNTANAFSYDDNYHLQTRTDIGSSGLNVNNLGLYDNTLPYKSSAVPVTPHISTKTIARETDSNGKLSVQIKAIAQQR